MQREIERQAVSSFQPPPPTQGDLGDKVTLLDILAPVLEGWRTMVVTTFVVGVIAGTAIFALQKPRYEAQLRLATVSSQRMPAALGGLASLAGLNPQQGGLNASPQLIAEFLSTNEVLRSVGNELANLPGGNKTRVVDAISRKDSGAVEAWKIERRMSEALRISVSDKTGLISLGVRATDSALARRVATDIVMRAREAFVNTAKAQAAELKRAQTARVDSAERQLRNANEILVAFRAANRVVVPYSGTTVRQTQLEDNVQVARQVYTQAVADREAAIAKELEETPAMVIVDPLPPVIPPLPGGRVAKTLAIMLVVAVFTAIWLVIGDGLRQLSPSRRAKIDRVRQAAGTLPLVGKRFRSTVS